MVARTRAELTVESWETALEPYAAKCMFMYDENQNVQKAKTDGALILKALPILGTLHSLDSNLNFVRSMLYDALLAIASKKASMWAFDKPMQEQWATVHCRRIMNICRCVSQATKPSTKAPPAWTKELPWMKSSSGASAAASSAAPAVEWVFGYDVGLSSAYRVKAGNLQGPREFASRLEIPDGAVMTDSVVAVFEDGAKWNVAQVTVSDLKHAQSKAAMGASAVMWEGVHIATGHELRIKRRPEGDRSMLMVLMDQSKMVHSPLDRCLSNAHKYNKV